MGEYFSLYAERFPILVFETNVGSLLECVQHNEKFTVFEKLIIFLYVGHCFILRPIIVIEPDR